MCCCCYVLTADVNAMDMYRVSPVHLAAENGHLLCLRALLDAGASCNTGTAEKKRYWLTTTGRHCGLLKADIAKLEAFCMTNQR